MVVLMVAVTVVTWFEIFAAAAAAVARLKTMCMMIWMIIACSDNCDDEYCSQSESRFERADNKASCSM